MNDTTKEQRPKAEKPKAFVHVNRHTILKNRKLCTKEPEIAVRKTKSGKAVYKDSVKILDKNGEVVAVLASNKDKPLPCGATIWLECKYDVE